MHTKPYRHIVPCAAALALAFSAGTAFADGDKEDSRAIHARLTGYQEVPTVSTVARGEFKGKIDKRTGMIDYELSYDGLEGTVRQSHIHLGARGTTGGIMVWLCGTATNPGPAGTPQCPDPSGTVTGTISAASVIGPGAQLVGAGEFEEVLAAIRAGVAYVNVHTTAVPSGEIRGQLQMRP